VIWSKSTALIAEQFTSGNRNRNL